jgi:hypothetical protein
MESQPQKRHSFRPLLFAPPQGRDAQPTSLPPAPPVAVPPPAKPRSDSHVRIRVPASAAPDVEIEFLDALELLDDLGDDQLTLSMALASIERATETGPRDLSALAALRAVYERVEDIRAVRNAIAEVQRIAVDKRLHRIFVGDAPLAEYLRGVYAWLHEVARALGAVAFELQTLSADWAAFRRRIDEAKNFHFDELMVPIVEDLKALAEVSRSFEPPHPPVRQLAAAIGRLFKAARYLEASLDQPVG